MGLGSTTQIGHGVFQKKTFLLKTSSELSKGQGRPRQTRYQDKYYCFINKVLPRSVVSILGDQFHFCLNGPWFRNLRKYTNTCNPVK